MTSTTTLEWYDRMPRVYKTDDEQLGYPLRRFMELIGEQVHDVNVLARRTLTDPATCESTWLPWLSAMVGWRHDPRISVADERLVLADPAHLQHGSIAAITRIVKLRYPTINALNVVPHWRGNSWLICIQTLQAETPATGTPISTWDELHMVLPTWDDLAPYPYDAVIDRVRYELILAADDERPAGVQFCHQWIDPATYAGPSDLLLAPITSP